MSFILFNIKSRWPRVITLALCFLLLAHDHDAYTHEFQEADIETNVVVNESVSLVISGTEAIVKRKNPNTATPYQRIQTRCAIEGCSVASVIAISRRYITHRSLLV